MLDQFRSFVAVIEEATLASRRSLESSSRPSLDRCRRWSTSWAESCWSTPLPEFLRTRAIDAIVEVRRILRRNLSKCGKFRRRLVGHPSSLAHRLVLVANESAVLIVPSFVQHRPTPLNDHAAYGGSRKHPGIWMSRGNVDELMVVEGAARDPTVVLETNSPWK